MKKKINNSVEIDDGTRGDLAYNTDFTGVKTIVKHMVDILHFHTMTAAEVHIHCREHNICLKLWEIKLFNLDARFAEGVLKGHNSLHRSILKLTLPQYALSVTQVNGLVSWV